MNVIEAIHSRRSVSAVTREPISRETVEKLLAAGNAAPNHYRVRPWRFVVLQGQALERFGEAHARSFLARNPEAKPEHLEVERRKAFRAPLVIAVASTKPVDAKEKDIENICAAAAACQNMLLAAHAMGLGVVWRTGLYYNDDVIKQFLGVTEQQHLIGVLYIGEAENHDTSVQERPGFEDRTTWL